jgi:predicted nucleic acid-binding protein
MTSEFVLLEVGNYLSGSTARGKFGVFLRSVRADAYTTVVPASTTLLARGFDLYQDRPDKDWSVTDCISFSLMRDHGITDALTADRHFEQAGFQSLLK